jgi:hypothetical protein
MNILIYPRRQFQDLLAELSARPRQVMSVPVGIRHTERGRLWLARVSPSPESGRSAVFNISLEDQRALDLQELSLDAVGRLVLGQGPWRGRVVGTVRTSDGIERLDRLDLIGPGMFRILTGDARHHHHGPDQVAPSVDPIRGRWSRTIGALGGLDTWGRLVRLHVGVIGVGRSGSLVAAALNNLGLRRLTLIDPDVIEPHNLGEMDVASEADLGRPKAEALADGLSAMRRTHPVSILPVVAPIADPVARAAASACDVLVCCVDNDAGRLVTGLLAALYHEVLVDIGTGVHFPDEATSPRTSLPPTRLMGFDVRLSLPGDGCLLCRGGLTQYDQAVAELLARRHPGRWFLAGDDWRRQRAGSLRSLNQVAAGLGLQMLQDLVADRIASSTWAQGEFEGEGRLAVRYPAPAPPTGAVCPLCARAGLGDEGLAL